MSLRSPAQGLQEYPGAVSVNSDLANGTDPLRPHNQGKERSRMEGHRDGRVPPGDGTTLWPSGRRSCGLPVRLPHGRRTWCSVGDPARSGQRAWVPESQPGMAKPALGAPTNRPRSTEPGHDPPETSRASGGSWPGPHCDGSSVPGPLASPVGWPVTPRCHRPTEARQLPGRGGRHTGRRPRPW
jgi:hypothetical protein